MQQNLKDYDRDILNELWKIRSGIQDIQQAHKQSEEAEKKYLDDSIPDRSPSPEEIPQDNSTEDSYCNENRLPQRRYVPTKKSSPEASPSPAQSHTPIETTPPPSEQPMLPSKRCNTLDIMRKAPSHLMMSDDQLLEEFFGHDQVDKLNVFKKSLEDEKMKQEEAEKEYEALLRKNVGQGQKLQIPVNPNRKSARYSCDVASEMEQLRARLHETAFKELEEFDKKFSPKLTRPGINPASGESSHSHQGSLDSSYPPHGLALGSSPQLMQAYHRRDHSLPVYMEPSSTSSPQSGSSNSSPFTSRSATQLLRNQVGGGEVNDMDQRSPTPPFQYGHIRQLSAGSTSSGSGTFSPPPNTGVTSPTNKQPSSSYGGALSYNMPRYGGSGGALNRYQNYDQASKLSGSNAPTSRAPNPNNPHFHSLKQSRTQQPQHPALMRTGSSGITGAGGGGGGGGASGLVSMGTNLSLTRNSSGGGVTGGGGTGGGATGLVTIGTNLSLTRNSKISNNATTAGGSGTNSTNSSSLNRLRNAVPITSQQVLPNPASNGVVVRRPEGTTNTQTHYSTSVIKKRRSNPSPDGSRNRRSSGEDFQASELQGQHHHSQSRNGYPSSGSQMLSANMNYNNLGSSGSDMSVLLPEQKSIPRSAQQGRLMASYERVSSSPKMTRKPFVQKGSSGVASSTAVANSAQNLTTFQQQSPILRKSEPNLVDRNGPSTVYPESIQPYMSTGDAKTQMKYYKYTSYTDSDKNGGPVDTSSNSPESTWC